MEKTAEPLKVPPQNDFGGCCEGWQAVGSGGNYFEGEQHRACRCNNFVNEVLLETACVIL
jgi:hypothetical protein